MEPSRPLVALADFEAAALARLPTSIAAYFQGGAADELTLRDNLAAFDRLRLEGRVLADLAGAHTRCELLGHSLAHPILLAPVAYHALAHPEGERATAQAADATDTLMVVSTQASQPLEAIAAAQPGRPWWFQLYVQPDRAFTRALIRRAEAAGATALVLTADSVVNGARWREWHAQFRLPPGVEAVILRDAPPLPTVEADPLSPVFGGLFRAQPPITWEALAWLKAQTRLPVVVKGLLSPRDVPLALAMGADALIVSNHGGRNLDTLPASLDALPRVVDAVAGRVPVLLDGGIRRGTDVLKALALGAQAVLIGRPVIHGLAVGGAAGVARVIQILRGELEAAMALTGCPNLDAINREVIWR